MLKKMHCFISVNQSRVQRSLIMILNQRNANHFIHIHKLPTTCGFWKGWGGKASWKEEGGTYTPGASAFPLRALSAHGSHSTNKSQTGSPPLTSRALRGDLSHKHPAGVGDLSLRRLSLYPSSLWPNWRDFHRHLPRLKDFPNAS